MTGAEFLSHLRDFVAQRWGRLTRRALLALSPVFIAFGLWGLGQSALQRFGVELSAMKEIVAEHPVLRGGPFTVKMFREFYAAGFIEFDNATLGLRKNVECDAVLEGFEEPEKAGPKAGKQAAEGETDRPQLSPKERAALARGLCHTDPGREILKEIAQWGGKKLTLAARDDSRDAKFGDACENGEAHDFYLPNGCHPGRWEASYAMGDEGNAPPPSETAAAPVLDDAPSQDLYGFLGLHPKQGFGDWTRFDATDSRGGVMILRKRIKPAASAGVITVDVIGEVVRNRESFEAEVRSLSGGERMSPRSEQLFCPKGDAKEDCAERDASSRKPFVTRLSFDYRSREPLEIVIKAKPVEAFEERVARLGAENVRWWRPESPEIEQDAANQDHFVRLTDHIVARCKETVPDILGVYAEAPAPAKNVCRLDWLEEKPGQRVRDKSKTGALLVQLLDPRQEDPIELAATRKAAVAHANESESQIEETHTVASEAARKLGLVPLVGVDEKDRYSLIGQVQPFVREGQTATIELTIDPRLQQRAVDAIAGLMQRAPSFKEIADHLKRKHDSRRRASLVLIDAGPKSGAATDDLTGNVLAAASWPAPQPGLSEWDLHAVEAWRPTLSPLATRAWAQTDGQDTPGSTFKTVVTLAAIDRAARGDDKIAAMLGAESPRFPGAAASEVERIFGAQYGFGWSATALVVPKFAGASGPAQSAHITTESGPICNDVSTKCDGPASRLRLRDMFARSDNIYFARLALALDENNVSFLAPGGQRVEYRAHNAPCEKAADESDSGCRRRLLLARMACRLYPTAARDLFEGVEAGAAGARLSRASRLFGAPIQLGETDFTRPRLLSVANNGIGQQAQAAPLAMATVMAEVAAGRIVLPRLLRGARRVGAEAEKDDPCAKYLPPGGKRPENDEPLFDPAPDGEAALDGARAQTMLDELREAMSDVVTRGTAAKAFAKTPELTRRTRGKTGTAQVVAEGREEDRIDTVWFAGWIEGLDAIPEYKDRRIAFACMITHVDPDGAAGGSTCAPFVRDFFKPLASAEAQPAATNETLHLEPAAEGSKPARRVRPADARRKRKGARDGH